MKAIDIYFKSKLFLHLQTEYASSLQNRHDGLKGPKDRIREIIENIIKNKIQIQ